MTRRQRIGLAVSQAGSYVAPVLLLIAAVFNWMPFKKPHGRAIAIGLELALILALAAFHIWQWHVVRRREKALRTVFERMEYP